ncbi:MAG: type III secretion system export apparatus subunit SctV [Candidatus Competibacterales bacterium]
MNTQKIQSLLLAMTSRNDIVLAVFLISIVFMIVLPMPTILVDVLIALNMTVSALLLMLSIYIPTPTSFSAFPSVLLFTTLFRLALSITTTRLILLEADAGDIVYTFGNFVVQGNMVVGVIIFLIITIVQFMVITKGSERVAEVSARFTLDAMPGKQMSIDADMRAGNITQDQARARRQELAKESQMYGAMDGAMKFVKGDAMAGLCITAINIVGGIAIGVTQMGMSAGEAANIFTILTIGDGLVAQIPALFISITAGIIVTRVNAGPGSEEDPDAANMGKEIGEQLLGQPKALMFVAAICVIFGLIPGFPTLIFFAIGAIVGGLGFTLQGIKTRSHLTEDGGISVPGDGVKGGAVQPAEVTGATVPLLVDLSDSLRTAVVPEMLNMELARVRRALFQDLGVPFPGVHLRFNNQLADDHYVLHLQEVPVSRGQLRPDHVFVLENPDQLDLLDVPHEKGDPFLPGVATLWVPGEHEGKLREAGVGVLNGSQLLCHHLALVLRRYAAEFIGVQETKHLLTQAEERYGELVQEVQRAVPIPKMAEILRRLVTEDISIRNLRAILEALVEWGEKEKDTGALTEYVRSGLKRYISYKYSGGQNALSVFMLDPKVEETIRGSIRQTPAGSFLALDPNTSRTLLERIKRTVGDLSRHSTVPVLLTAMDIRRYVRKLIEQELFELPVLSYQELAQEISVQPISRIALTQEANRGAAPANQRAANRR